MTLPLSNSLRRSCWAKSLQRDITDHESNLSLVTLRPTGMAVITFSVQYRL
jgi:hypothetical protein